MRSYLPLLLIMIIGAPIFANNVEVANVALTNQNTSAGVNNPANHTFVNFDVSWDNSWRTSTGPANWDAVWVFVKYQEFGQDYQHATLSTNAGDHSVTTNNGVGVSITPSADGKGVFMYRNADGGPGSINWQDVLLRWDYPTDGLDDTTSVTVQVFAVEMVYIPEGSFYLGDGNINNIGSNNTFRINNQPSTTAKGREACLISSEGPISFVSSGSTDLNSCYDAGIGRDYTLPAAYPKGFQAFYTMKYEVSQKQYVDFFNTLPTAPVSSTQKSNRNLTISSSSAYRNNFLWSGNNLDDADLSNLGGGSGDRAQNYTSYDDAIAYLDWAALRPMSEFEYEKMCRGNDNSYGPIYPIRNEYAWGNTSITPISGGTSALTNDNSVSEGLANPSTNNANAHYNSAVVGSGSTNSNGRGPVRVGIFAAKNASADQRVQSGASYYGVMELSGNLSEITIAPAFLETFSTDYVHPSDLNGSIHGDGELDANGNGNANTWSRPVGFGNNPNSVTQGLPVQKGGSWSDSPTRLTVSYRNTVSTSSSSIVNWYESRSRRNNIGFRGVRTAP
jgi:formylglycine-generating enzyme required for sulfatase activity